MKMALHLRVLATVSFIVTTTIASSLFCYQDPHYPRDCKEVYEKCDLSTESGIYWIQPNGADEPFTVFCNNSIDGGGWTVIQRRVDGAVDFYRSWAEYKGGFGFQETEFWLGNDRISQLTNQKRYELRIDMNNVIGEPYFAKYDLFRISDEWSKYRLVDLGQYLPESTANFDGMRTHLNKSFTTYDRDNDIHAENYAQLRSGAWWYYNGADSGLNRRYFDCVGSGCFHSIYWKNIPGGDNYHLKYAEMKLRPRQEN